MDRRRRRLGLEERGHDVVRLVWGPETRGLEELVRDAQLDAAFIALHGRGGEDGCVQGALELLGIPYTGSSVLASALAMDKLKAKELFRLHNVPTPPYYVVSREALGVNGGGNGGGTGGGTGNRGDAGDVLAELHGSFGFPVIVKPRGEGLERRAHQGARPRRAGKGRAALALQHDAHALVERFVKATEVHVGVLDGRVLGAIEVVPKSGLYDYASKYTAGATEYICPPRLGATRARGVLNLAERAVRALECSGACRVDLLVTEGENEYVLEVNTLPGMTATSLLPKIALAAGMSYGELCETVLAGASLHSGLPRRERLAAREIAAELAPKSGAVARVGKRVAAV